MKNSKKKPKKNLGLSTNAVPQQYSAGLMGAMKQHVLFCFSTDEPRPEASHAKDPDIHLELTRARSQKEQSVFTRSEAA